MRKQTETKQCVNCGKDYEVKLIKGRSYGIRGLKDTRPINAITCSSECSKEYHRRIK